MISMNAWASCPERFSTILTSLSSEKIVATRAICSSIVRVLLINCFQAGVFDRSAVRQNGYLRIVSQAQHHVEFLYAPGTHLSLAGSIPQCGSSAPAEVPIDPVVSERAGVHDPREVFHLCPCGIGCGIYSRFVNRDLTSGNFRIYSRSRDV